MASFGAGNVSEKAAGRVDFSRCDCGGLAIAVRSLGARTPDTSGPADQWSSLPNQLTSVMISFGWVRKYPMKTIGAVMRSQSCMGAPLQGHYR